MYIISSIRINNSVCVRRILEQSACNTVIISLRIFFISILKLFWRSVKPCHYCNIFGISSYTCRNCTNGNCCRSFCYRGFVNNRIQRRPYRLIFCTCCVFARFYFTCWISPRSINNLTSNFTECFWPISSKWNRFAWIWTNIWYSESICINHIVYIINTGIFFI